MTLALVHSRAVRCWPWHLADLWGAPVFGADCQDCSRPVAQPVSRAKERPVCLYCAITETTEDRPLEWGEP